MVVVAEVMEEIVVEVVMVAGSDNQPRYLLLGSTGVGGLGYLKVFPISVCQRFKYHYRKLSLTSVEASLDQSGTR